MVCENLSFSKDVTSDILVQESPRKTRFRERGGVKAVEGGICGGGGGGGGDDGGTGVLMVKGVVMMVHGG